MPTAQAVITVSIASKIIFQSEIVVWAVLTSSLVALDARVRMFAKNARINMWLMPSKNVLCAARLLPTANYVQRWITAPSVLKDTLGAILTPAVFSVANISVTALPAGMGPTV